MALFELSCLREDLEGEYLYSIQQEALAYYGSNVDNDAVNGRVSGPFLTQ